MSDVDGFWDELFITQEEVEKRKLQPLEKEFIIENRETAFNDVVRRLAKVYGINLRSGKEVQDKARLETARQIFAELETWSWKALPKQHAFDVKEWIASRPEKEDDKPMTVKQIVWQGWIKQNFIRLAREHKAQCGERECEIQLLSLLEAIRRLKIPITDKEAGEFI